MSIAPLPITSDLYYARILKTYFSWNTESESSLYWESFAKSQGFTSTAPPTDTPELRSQFEAFLVKYKELGITPSSLTLQNTIPTNPYYNLIMNSFFPTLSTSEKTDIWNGFVESQGVSSNPQDTSQTREAFAAYIKIISTASISQTLNDYFGSLSTGFRITLWERFAASQGVTSLIPANTPQTQADLLTFCQRYLALGISQESLKLTNSLPSTPPFYQNYMNGFFGDRSPSEQKDLWNAFLYNQGYTTNPVDSPSLQKAFADYISSLSAKLNVYENAINLSPQEMQSRLIFSNTMKSLQAYLNTTQDLVRIQSATLTFYGALQQAYTEMLTRVPNLTANQANTSADFLKVITNRSDLTKFTFGFNDISLSDVIKLGVNEALKDTTQPFVFGNSSPQNVTYVDASAPGGARQYSMLLGQYSFQVIDAGAGIKKMRISAKEDSSSTNASLEFVISDPSTTSPILLSVNDMVQKANDSFIQIFQTPAGSAFLNAINGKFGIPGQFPTFNTANAPFNTGAFNTYNDQQVKNRVETNALLQQYVENIKSLRDVVRNTATQFQASLGQSRDSINSQTSLWTDILESIDTIMQAINKR